MVTVELLYVHHSHVYQIWSKLIVIEFVLFYLSLRFCLFLFICHVAHILTHTSSIQCSSKVYMICGGDFNTYMSRNGSRHTKSLVQFCLDCNLECICEASLQNPQNAAHFFYLLKIHVELLLTFLSI